MLTQGAPNPSTKGFKFEPLYLSDGILREAKKGFLESEQHAWLVLLIGMGIGVPSRTIDQTICHFRSHVGSSQESIERA